jgi:hypothetical protein
MQQTLDELTTAIDHIRQSPSDQGTLELIVRRPAVDQREVVEVGELDPDIGLVGDTWSLRPSSQMPDESPHPDMQLNIMNARCIDVIAGGRDRWPLAGDQLYLDLDLSPENLPAGTRLRIGSGVIEVTDRPHNGCQKFSQRFGVDALRFVNSELGRSVRARGINAKVVEGGTIRQGDRVTRLG